MQGGRHQLKIDRNPGRRADQVQPPAEELLLFRGAVAAIGASSHLVAAPGAHAATDWHGHAIDHKDVSRHPDLAQGGGDEGQPVGELVQPAIEARDINPPRQIGRCAQDAHRAFMLILEVLGRHDRNQEHFRVRHLGADITVMVQPIHQRIDQHKSRYNPIGVPWFLLVRDSVSASRIVPEEPMGVN